MFRLEEEAGAETRAPLKAVGAKAATAEMVARERTIFMVNEGGLGLGLGVMVTGEKKNDSH